MLKKHPITNNDLPFASSINYAFMKLLFTLFIALVTCTTCAQKKEKKFASPAGYDLNQPEKIMLPAMLLEISGITFNTKDPNMLLAQQDEDGRLFYFNPKAEKINVVKFAGPGDYEDLAIVNDRVVMLRSDGTCFTFPLLLSYQKVISAVKTEDLLPKGEYESLASGQDGRLYVLCKQCTIDKKTDQTTGYILKLLPNGSLSKEDTFSINTQEITNFTDWKGKAFRPSALTLNPNGKEWYILSSINKLLVITDLSWHVKAAYSLNPKLFNQPEGMAFDHHNNLYISNEGGKGGQATLLKFTYNAKK